MSTLKDRINALGQVTPDLSTVTDAIGKDYGGIITIPQVRVQIHPGYLQYEDLQSTLITADGAPVPATAPGTWGQLYAAGNKRGQR